MSGLSKGRSLNCNLNVNYPFDHASARHSYGQWAILDGSMPSHACFLHYTSKITTSDGGNGEGCYAFTQRSGARYSKPASALRLRSDLYNSLYAKSRAAEPYTQHNCRTGYRA